MAVAAVAATGMAVAVGVVVAAAVVEVARRTARHSAHDT